jgi:hypothetical protein
MESRTVRRLRRDVMTGLKRAGFRVALRRAWNLWDVEAGEVGHCPVCYNDSYRDATDPKCPSCYGTSFEGGYRPVELVWAVVDRSAALDEKVDTGGRYVESSQTLKVQCPPMVGDGDMVAEIRHLGEGDSILEIGQVYEVVGGTTQDGMSGRDDSAFGEYRAEDSVVSQSVPLKPMFQQDPRSSSEFWWTA